MQTFAIGLLILAVGGIIYGKVCEKIMKPDDRRTPAITKPDGVDYVPLKKWRNSMLNLINIAGTGPVLGPIQGILFGPIAFILIPLGCIFAGAVHDYYSGMLSMRNGGIQMPTLVKKYAGKGMYGLYIMFSILLTPLVTAVFIYTPGDMMATQVLGLPGTSQNVSTWVIYAIIFVYFIIATLLPLGKLIGKLYPIFGIILSLSAVGIFFGLIFGGYQLDNLSMANWRGVHPQGIGLIPIFFITVACGMVSGFHSSKTALVARSMTSEHHGRPVLFNTMLLEGFIAMVWAGAAMAIMNKGLADSATSAIAVVGIVARDMLGPVAGMLAIIGVIVLPITSGDTALRYLRMLIAEHMGIDQKSYANRLKVSIPIFIIVAALLVWAKVSPDGFTVLWRYFAWSNQTDAIFAFAVISMYFIAKGRQKVALISLLPGAWYAFITFTYIMNARIGFNIPMNISYLLGFSFAIVYIIAIVRQGNKMRRTNAALEDNIT